MDIAALSTALSQSQVKQQASLSVMKMAMNSAESNAVDLTEMLGQMNQKAPQAAHPHLGSQIDIRV